MKVYNLEYSLVVFLALLFFFWPIPHTIAVRYILLSLSSIFLIYLYVKQKPCFTSESEVRWFAYLLGALTGWFYFQALLISPETSWALKELNGQWLVGLICALLGFFSPTVFKNPNKVFFIVVLVVMIHVLYIDLYGIRAFVKEGIWETRLMGLTEGSDKANYLTNFAFAILASEIFYRLKLKRTVLPVDDFILYSLFVLTIFSSYLEAMRFGFIGIVFMVLTLTAFWIFKQNSKDYKVILPIMAAIMMISAVSISTFTQDERWKNTMETLPIALDTTNNKTWIDWNKYEKPKLSNGEEVSQSDYMRVAMAKEGAILVLENPFGIGYGRNAFGHGVKAKHGEGAGHSHSGIIDLAIGTGFFGVALWMIFVVMLVFKGAKSFYRYDSYFGLVLCFIAGGYFFRMIFDSIIRDHMLEQFMFLAGLFLALSVKEVEVAKANQI